ncbi:hypothetical protein BSNK01_30440 [Bacillaceae bacterium]
MILTWIVWMLAIYGVSHLTVLLLKRFTIGKRAQGKAHYLLLLQNSQSSVEWAVRTLRRQSALEGRDFSLTYVDFGSTDDTMEIVKRFGSGGEPGLLAEHSLPPAGFPSVVVIDLRGERRERSG